ncbi:MAG: helix-turn-helix domain-containing protein [Bacteroidota bacterium]
MRELNIIGLVLVGLFILFILNKPQKLLSDWLLAGVNACLGLYLLSDLFLHPVQSSAWFVFNFSIVGLQTPLLITYFIVILQENQEWKPGYYLWFSLLLVSIVYVCWDHFGGTAYNQANLDQLWDDPPLPYLFFYKANQLLGICGLFWILGQIRAYRQNIREQYSYIEPIHLEWVRIFSWIYLILLIVIFFSFLLYNVRWFPLDITWVYFVVNGAMVLAIFFLSLMGIRNYVIADYLAKELSTKEPEEKIREIGKAHGDVSAIFARLEAYFVEEQIYLESKITLPQVAARLKVPVHVLSQVINQETDGPFYDFVNRYRVDHLKESLLDAQKSHLTILALGYESGFNSKASLNRIFKQQVGLTPSQYQKQNLLSGVSSH